MVCDEHAIQVDTCRKKPSFLSADHKHIHSPQVRAKQLCHFSTYVALALTKLATVECPGIQGSLRLFAIGLSPQLRACTLLLALCGLLLRDWCSQLTQKGQEGPTVLLRKGPGPCKPSTASLRKSFLRQWGGGSLT